MLRLLMISICLSLTPLSTAQANDDSLPPLKSAIGGGVGFAGLLHIDYQRWVASNTSIELGLTPMVLHNVVAGAVTQHIPLNANTKSVNTNLVLSGMWVHIINMGGIAGGPGFRAGIEALGKRYGASLAGGPAIAIGGEFDGTLLVDARLTLWRVKRHKK